MDQKQNIEKLVGTLQTMNSIMETVEKTEDWKIWNRAREGYLKALRNIEDELLKQQQEKLKV